MDILSILDSKGVNYKHVSGNEYVLECLNSANHSDGKDSTYSLRLNVETLQMHCFACGFKRSEVGTTKWLLGEDIDDMSLRCLGLRGRLKRASEAIDLTSEEEQAEVFVPPGEPWLEEYRGISAETFRRLEAFKCSRGRFQNRICFKMYFDGVLRGIEGRALAGETPKYLRTSGFNAKRFMYPYDLVKEHHPPYVVLVEGIFDAINILDKIAPIGLCIYGTENFGPEKIRAIINLGVEEVVLFLDKDAAGQAAQKKIGLMLEEWFRVTEADISSIPLNLPASVVKGKLYWKDCGDLSKEELEYCVNNRRLFNSGSRKIS